MHLTRRRLFGGLLAGAAIALTPDPVKKYFFAPDGGWLSTAELVPPWDRNCDNVFLQLTPEFLIVPPNLRGAAERILGVDMSSISIIETKAAGSDWYLVNFNMMKTDRDMIVQYRPDPHAAE